MPKLGMTMESAMILRWHRAPGDEVREGQLLLEVETDKAGLDVEAQVSGRLVEILAAEGDVVLVGAVIARLDAALAPAAPAPEPGPPAPERARISPAARRLAREHGLDLSRVRGTGPDGRIGVQDVMSAVAAAPQAPRAAPPGRALTPLRRAIGEHMTVSQGIPQFSVSRAIAVAGALGRLEELRAGATGGVRLTLTDLLVWALGRAAAAHPGLNAHYRPGDGGEPDLKVHDAVHVGLVVGTPAGILVPVIPHAGTRSVQALASQREHVVSRARQGRMDGAEEATITLSNLGPWGVDTFVAMLNPPQVAILAVGAVAPWVFEDAGGLRVERALRATLTVDHRAADGIEAARLLGELARLMQPQALPLP